MRYTPNTLTLTGRGLLFILALLFSEGVAAQLSNADFLYEKGMSAQSNDDLYSAIEMYTLALETNPNYTQVRLERSRAYAALNKTKSAIYDLDAIIHDNPYNLHALETRGQLYFDLEDYSSAYRDFQTALGYHKTAEGFVNIGITLKAMGKTDDALTAFQTAIDINPKVGEAYCGMGDIYAEKGEEYLREAMNYYALALQNTPSDAFAWRSRGILFYSIGEIDRAIYDFNTSLNFVVDFEAYLYLSKCYLETNKWEKAQRAITQAVRIEREHPEVYFTLGLIELSTGKYEAALESFWAARGFESTNAEYIKHIGLAYYHLGQPYEATRSFYEYLDLVGQDPEIDLLTERCYQLMEQNEVEIVENQEEQEFQTSTSTNSDLQINDDSEGFDEDMFR